MDSPELTEEELAEFESTVSASSLNCDNQTKYLLPADRYRFDEEAPWIIRRLIAEVRRLRGWPSA